MDGDKRGRVRRTLALVMGLFAAGAALAADYPARPIRYVVAFAPGGINDIMARIVAQKLNEAWGQPVIVDNRPGAGGNLAAEMVAKATPDGYTFMNISTAHTIAQTLYTRLNYSLERDMAPVVVLGSAPLMMVVNPKVPVKNLAELAAWAKKNRLIYASGGVGVISHLSMEMLKLAAGFDATHVPYKGVGPAVPDLISGEAHAMINAVPELFPHAKGGRLRIIGVLTEKRHPFMPEVPTFIEQGHKEFVMGNWTGIVAPKGIPRAVADKLAQLSGVKLGKPTLVSESIADQDDGRAEPPREYRSSRCCNFSNAGDDGASSPPPRAVPQPTTRRPTTTPATTTPARRDHRDRAPGRQRPRRGGAAPGLRGADHRGRRRAARLVGVDRPAPGRDHHRRRAGRHRHRRREGPRRRRLPASRR